MECKYCRNEFEELEYGYCSSCWEQSLKAIDEYPFPCSDHSCVFTHPGGMGTNGGCHCLDLFPLPRALKYRLKTVLQGARERSFKRGRRDAVYWVEKALSRGMKIPDLVGNMKKELL